MNVTNDLKLAKKGMVLTPLVDVYFLTKDKKYRIIEVDSPNERITITDDLDNSLNIHITDNRFGVDLDSIISYEVCNKITTSHPTL